MAAVTLRHPALIEPDPDSGTARLRVRRCSCGHVQFPPQTFGCERCGAPADAANAATVPARGVLMGVATVFAHTKLPTPYAVGRVLFDDGFALDVRLETAEINVGQRVAGRLVSSRDERAGELLDLVFASGGAA